MKLEKLSAIELGKLVTQKVVSPVEVIEYFSQYIDQHNCAINAFVDMHVSEALAAAQKLEDHIMHYPHPDLIQEQLPLAGVPIGLKDFLPTKIGWKATHGGVKHLVTIDDSNSPFCEAAESLGAIAIGKTNAPAFGFSGTTHNYMFGYTSTPFNTADNSGGSSGGSAAAVGGMLVPLAEGGDAGGSIRIPAAWCGCFGFKPSAGLVPSICRPDAWTATHPYCCGGPITRTVKDAAIVLNKMARFDMRDPLSVPVPRPNFLERRSVKGMKIGYTFDFDLYPKCEKEIEDAMMQAIEALRQAGALLEEVNFDFHYSLEEIENSWLLGISIDDSLSPAVVSAIKEHPEDVPVEFIEWHERAKTATMSDYRKFHEIRTDILDAHADVFDRYDIILAPVSGCMPVPNILDPHSNMVRGPKTISGKQVDTVIGFAYTYLENMIGTPAASIPVGIGSGNRPIGMQIIGRRYFDETVFDVAYALEEIKPWVTSYDLIS